MSALWGTVYELTVSDWSSKINIFDPKLRPAVAMLVRTQQIAARRWQPPQGLTLATEEIGGVPCFVLEPLDKKERPAMVYCHGGAFLLPVQTAWLELAAHYALTCEMRMVLPEYRLLPKYPAPAALEDVLAVCEAVRPALLYGESAGGMLAACAAQEVPGVKGMVLIYPVLDDAETPYPSKALYPDAPWSLEAHRAVWPAYLSGITGEQRPRLIPMAAPDLSRLPPTYIEAEEIDILRDEALAFAEKLREQGVPVEVTVNRGAYHGFDTQLDSPYVRRVLGQRVDTLRRIVSTV